MGRSRPAKIDTISSYCYGFSCGKESRMGSVDFRIKRSKVKVTMHGLGKMVSCA